MWSNISERYIGSARSGGKAPLLSRRDISFENEVALRWPRKQKGMRAGGQPKKNLESFYWGLFHSPGQSLRVVLLPGYPK